MIAALSTAIGVVGAADLIGHPARTVHVITIFVGALGAGLSLGRALERRRTERDERAAPNPP